MARWEKKFNGPEPGLSGNLAYPSGSWQRQTHLSRYARAGGELLVGASMADSAETRGQPQQASTRIDRWLTAARWFKSRSQAQQACESGRVTVNGVAVKPSRTVQVGDKVTARAPRGLVVAVVQDIEEKRQGANRARELYEDQSPPMAKDLGMPGVRPRGHGRPTKADRRAIERMTGTSERDEWDD